MFSKIPFIGGILGAAMGFAMAALYGGIGVIGTSFVAKKIAPFVPWLSTKVFYPIAGLLLAALAQKFLPFDASIKKQIATGLATGGVAIAAYKLVIGAGDDDLSGEYGTLEGFGDGYAVIPGYAGYGEYQTIPGYGDDDMGAYQVMYGQEAL
jgi:hypothetical protein